MNKIRLKNMLAIVLAAATFSSLAACSKNDEDYGINMDIYLNNGVLERTVNKTKAIKRQMFNRANITLLGNKLISLNT